MADALRRRLSLAFFAADEPAVLLLRAVAIERAMVEEERERFEEKGGKRRHFEGARDATGKTWERTERTRFFPPSEYSRRNLGGLNLTANRLGWNGASIVPRAPARCAVLPSRAASLSKSRV